MKSPLQALIAAFVRNPVLANLIALATCVGGAVAYTRLPRETFPETSVNYIVITVPYPGAAPEDVEQGIAVKIEQAIEGIPGIWEISSRSDENVVNVGAAYDPAVTSTTEMLRLIQDRVNAVDGLPAGAERPVVTEAVVRNSVINVGIHGQVPEGVIKQVAEELRDELLADPGISQVSISGVRDYEISIQVSDEAMQTYGLTIQQIIGIVSRSSLNLPAGTLRTQHEEINIRTSGQRVTAAEFKDLPVIALPDGTTVRLGQIALVRDRFEETPLIGRIDGQRGATIHVLKTGLEDLSAIAAAVRGVVANAQRDVPEGVVLAILADKSRDVDARIAMLIQNGLMGILLLMICLLLFMDFRAAVGVAMGLPVAMAGALLVMWLTGQSLNLISLFGLIMADAIVLDDSIIIADSVLARERSGMTPALAAVEGTRHVTLPVINASLTTLVMFVPMMFVEGVMGKLIYVLPVAVVSSIVVSVGEAFFVLPAHLAEWRGPQKRTQAASRRSRIREWLNRRIDVLVSRVYRKAIEHLIQWRWVVLSASAAVLLICVGLVWGGRTPFILFPKLDCNSLRARVRLPEGTPIDVTAAAAAQLEEAALSLNNDPELKPAGAGRLVRHVSSVVGEWPEYIPQRGSGLGEVVIELMPSEVRKIDVALILAKWRKAAGSLPYGVAPALTREELGPQEKPIEIRLLGENLDQLRQASDALKTKLGEYSGVFDVTDDLLPGKREYRVMPKPEARNLGLTVGEIGQQLRQGLYGGEAVRVPRGREEVKVVVSFADAERRSLSAIQNLRIRTPSGVLIPFQEVADTQLVRGYSSIGRQDGFRRVRVQADVDEHYANAEQIVQSLERSFLPSLPKQFPGVSVRIDGERKRMSQSLGSLVDGFVIALVATYVILAAALRSYVQPLILMTAVPLGITGAILGHTLLGMDLSLMSVFGMTSVAGIVVNDSLVLMDQVNQNLAEGRAVGEAVAAGSQSRVIAVFLTAVTNVAGMAPLLAERSAQAVTLIPIAVSVAFGLCFAMLLTLFIVPAMFMAVNDLRRFFHWLRHGGLFPKPEDVEPVHLDIVASA